MPVLEVMLVGRIAELTVVIVVVRSGADEAIYKINPDYNTEHNCTCIQTTHDSTLVWCLVHYYQYHPLQLL